MPVTFECVDEAENGGVTLWDARDCHCRWPYGDPKDDTFRYCGREKVADSSYCPAHKAIAIGPKQLKAA